MSAHGKNNKKVNKQRVGDIYKVPFKKSALKVAETPNLFITTSEKELERCCVKRVI